MKRKALFVRSVARSQLGDLGCMGRGEKSRRGKVREGGGLQQKSGDFYCLIPSFVLDTYFTSILKMCVNH